MTDCNIIQFEPTMYNHASGMWCPFCEAFHFEYIALAHDVEPIQIFKCLDCGELFWDHWATDSTDGTLEIGDIIEKVTEVNR